MSRLTFRPHTPALASVLLSGTLLTGAFMLAAPPANAADPAPPTAPLARETHENRAGFPAASKPEVAREDEATLDRREMKADEAEKDEVSASPRATAGPAGAAGAASDQPDAIGAGEPPGDVVGTYRLRSVNDQPLPTLIGTWEEDGRTCKEHVLSGAIQLKADSTYQVRTLTRTDCGGRQGAEREQEGERGTWKLTGNALYLNEDTKAEPEAGARGDRELTGGIPVENLGGTGQFADGMLSIGLENGKAVATFEQTDAKPGPG